MRSVIHINIKCSPSMGILEYLSKPYSSAGSLAQEPPVSRIPTNLIVGLSERGSHCSQKGSIPCGLGFRVPGLCTMELAELMLQNTEVKTSHSTFNTLSQELMPHHYGISRES